MDKTGFAGLTRLAPGESLALDGFSFQAQNPTILDLLLQIGAVTHRHDAHAALADPITEPALVVLDVGGTIPADQSIFVTYTLVDSFGGETLPRDPAVNVTTDPGLEAPLGSPDAVVDHAAGTLVSGSYAYAITATDGVGGESMIGPSVEAIIEPGDANNQVTLDNLQTLATDVGGSGWRAYRSVNGGEWNLLETGSTEALVDDGTLCIGCDEHPPVLGGTTNATNVLKVTVPAAGQPANAVSFRIYASSDGDFLTPSLLGEYPVADYGVEKTYTSLALTDGAPPDVSTALPGALQIDPETEIANFTWRAPVANVAALPPTGNRNGDVRIVLDTHAAKVWTGAAWIDLAGGGGIPELELGDSLAWDVGGIAVIELIGSGVLTWFDNFATDRRAEYDYDATYSTADLAVAAGKLTVADAFACVFRPPGMTGGDFEWSIELTPVVNEWGRCGVRLDAPTADDAITVYLDEQTNQIWCQVFNDNVATVVESVAATAPNAGETRWLRIVRVGNTFTYELWTTDPELGGAPTVTGDTTLAGADIATFATGDIWTELWNGVAVGGSGGPGDCSYDDLRTEGQGARHLDLKITPVGGGAAVTKLVLDEDGNSDFMLAP